MASIDKIYCDSRKDFVQFYEWCEMFEEECYKETGELLTDYFYLTPLEWPEQDKYRRDVLVTNTPFNIDKWLNLHCPIKFVRDRLLEWGYKPSRKQLLYIEKGFDREKYRQKKQSKHWKCLYKSRSGTNRKIACSTTASTTIFRLQL